MAEIPARFLVHTVQVRPLLGHGSAGEVYGDAETVPCLIRERTETVLDNNGVQVSVKQTRLIAAHGAQLTEEAEVVGYGRITTTARHDDGGLGAWQHVSAELS